jgi:RNA polymerase sigma-70 factor (ECF subfamily)
VAGVVKTLDLAAPALCSPNERASAAELADAAVRAHYDFVWRSIRRLGIPESSADDAAQQVFCIYARRALDVEPGKEKTFLFGVVLRIARSARRAYVRSEEVLDEAVLSAIPSTDADPEQLLEDRHARRILDAILAALPLELRTVFVLYELEEMTMAEIATIMDLPSGTVASRLRRAREAFEDASRRMRSKSGGRR